MSGKTKSERNDTAVSYFDLIAENDLLLAIENANKELEIAKQKYFQVCYEYQELIRLQEPYQVAYLRLWENRDEFNLDK